VVLPDDVLFRRGVVCADKKQKEVQSATLHRIASVESRIKRRIIAVFSSLYGLFGIKKILSNYD
jgi:hypothetical protein